jgi:RHS repeat-associated protein
MDMVGDYPMILLVIDPNGWSVDKSYYHAGGQTLMQQAGENRYFYLQDRLGSTRQVINTSASVVNSYTYDPWGNAFASETSETVSNHYQFANYHWDETVGMYYLNARWYDPVILRFTGRDPVRGDFQEPLTLHPYLYCLNNAVNATDPTGEFLIGLMMGGQGMSNSMRTSSAGFGAQAMAIAGRIYVAAYVRTVGLSYTVMQYYYGTGGSNISINANKLHHVFGKAGHNLGPLVNQFGSEEGAYAAVQAAINLKMAGVIDGQYNQIAVNVGGYIIYVSGIVIDGIVRIGTFSIK